MHNLQNVDCTEGMKTIPSESIDLVIADPPYNIGSTQKQNVQLKQAGWDTFASGEFQHFTDSWLTEAIRVLKKNGQIFIYGSAWTTDLFKICIKAEASGLRMMQTICWCYTQGQGPFRLKKYTANSELLVWLIKEPAHSWTFNEEHARTPYTENEMEIALAKGKGRVQREKLQRGRPMRTWWEIPRVNSRAKIRQVCNHPAMKPRALAEILVKVHSNAKDTILIPFVGSGSEFLTALELGREVIGYEKEKSYYDFVMTQAQMQPL